MRLASTPSSAICATLLAARCASAITLDVSSTDSIKQAASRVAHGMLNYYKGNETGQTPGLLPQPYYWWEGGAMWGGLIDYWYYTGDETYNEITSQALLFQVGPDNDYMPPNQTKSLGNDDQAFWGMAAMRAAEVNYPNPPSGQPQWLALAQAVFNSQALRWDNSTCGGGLRWQIFSFNSGYNYKNSISQGGFFNIAARLGMYTQNQTYFEWADKMWTWTEAIGLVSSSYQVFDGSDDTINCTKLQHTQWSYNSGIFLHGAATMWNQTTGDTQALWRTRVEGLLAATSIYFTGTNNQVMYEVECEPSGICNNDQQSFKAYLSRWMAATTKIAPFTTDTIMPLLQQSAAAAAQSCSGGTDGMTCGTKWYVSGWDKTYGVGQQMCALEVIQSNLIGTVAGPLTSTTGGTSKGDSSAGTAGDDNVKAAGRITTSDRAGAIIITILVLVLVLGGGCWVVL